MLFSSIPFLYYFLPAVLVVYFLTPEKGKNAVLLASSLIFYGWGEPKYLGLMVCSILLFYGCGRAIGGSRTPRGKKFWLTVSVVMGLALLVVFKYADFFISGFNAVTEAGIPALGLALPIGISFYTFQCISYTVDVYRGHAAPQKSLVRFGTYVALFPQLIAGPIVRYVDVARELESRTHSWEKFAQGLRRFLVGLSKKVLLANQLGAITNAFRSSGEKSLVFYWLYAVAFTLHIYFDFSGYSDMAIGLGRIFGFQFVENFDYPYMARSIQEFWRRWHMSLGTWFRDYVYIPLGGNRVSRGHWVANTLVVWMLTGLWHGASWNFVVWGLLFALLLLFEKWVPGVKKLPPVMAHVYVMVLVTLSFVIFNAADLSQAWGDLGGMFGFGGLPWLTGETLYYLKSNALLLALAAVGATPLARDLYRKVAGKPLVAILEPVVLGGLLLLCTAYLVDGSFNPFLYFRF